MIKKFENVEIDSDTLSLIGLALIVLIYSCLFSKIGYIPFWLFEILCTIYTINLTIKFILIKRIVKSHAYWESTAGTIEDIKIKTWSDLEDGSEHFDIRLSYLYYVNNVAYYGNKISVCPDREVFFSLESVNSYILDNSFKKNGRATVYYNPANPTKSVLKRGACNEYFEWKSNYLGRIVFLSFIIIVYFVVWSTKL
jgi:hypothetical protein